MAFGKKKAQKIRTLAMLERETRQLTRLQTIMDVVFALLIWRIFQFLPRPSKEEWGLGKELFDILLNYAANFQIVFIGIILVLIYWGQNNTLFGNLSRTDGRHAVISLLQVFFLMIYLYFVRLGVEFEGDVSSLALQSISLALAGFAAISAWRYACKDRRLITEALSDEEIRELRIKTLPEPLAAVISIPFAWLSSEAWSLSMLAGVVLFGWLLKRGKPAPEAESASFRQD